MTSPEIRRFRCCMCPNINKPWTAVCPSNPLTGEPREPCTFVRQFVDGQGAKYRVLAFLRHTFRVMYNRPGSSVWKSFDKIPFSSQFDKAQEDLNQYAQNNGWNVLAMTKQCRVCGCTDDRACPGGCHWVEYDLCSSCVGKETNQ